MEKAPQGWSSSYALSMETDTANGDASRGKALSLVQEFEDAIIERFCSVDRRMTHRMDWMPDTTEFADHEEAVRDRIAFFEERGYYLFQEPWLDHEPAKHRFRVVLTFRPTENNR